MAMGDSALECKSTFRLYLVGESLCSTLYLTRDVSFSWRFSFVRQALHDHLILLPNLLIIIVFKNTVS